jgi:cytochrome c556
MIRKCLIFAASAALLLVVAGIVAQPGLSKADDEERPLEKIMEKINKNSSIIKKGVRNTVYWAKDQKKVEQAAKDIVKLAKEARPIKDAVKKAKDVAEPQKKWEEFLDSLIKNSEKLGDIAAKPKATQKDAKAAFDSLNKVCTDCHKDFRIDETTF